VTQRSDLVALLEAHAPEDEKERADRARMIAWARSLADPLSRAQPEAHFTGSAVVVDPAGERVCLVHHARLRRWLQPGGHAEPADGGSMLQTALREAREETGCDVQVLPAAPFPIDVDVHEIPARPGEPAHFHLDVRAVLVATNPEALEHDPNESFGAQWVTWSEALERASDPALRRLLDKARRQEAGGG